MANTGNGYAFTDGVKKLAGILTGVAEELERFAESFETEDGELAETNASKTREETDLEDAVAARVAAPLVNALDGISTILNGATAKITAMTAEPFNGGEKADG